MGTGAQLSTFTHQLRRAAWNFDELRVGSEKTVPRSGVHGAGMFWPVIEQLANGEGSVQFEAGANGHGAHPT